jgi:deazaflavin-dependent oxidoreductase (nitroreductase family)
MKAPTGVKRWFFRAPIWLYNHHLGALLGSRFVLINHIGRTSGLARQVVVEVVRRDPDTGAIIVCSGWGTTSQWYQNLTVHPDVTIQFGAHVHKVHAIFLDSATGGEEMVRYAEKHPKAAQKLSKFMNLECDGTPAGYRSVGEQLPFVRLDPCG